MDVLTTEGWSADAVKALIAKTEAAYPSLRAENERIRTLAARPDVRSAVAAAGVDVDAAMVSTCRSDVLRCGRCAFWRVVRCTNLEEAPSASRQEASA